MTHLFQTRTVKEEAKLIREMALDLRLVEVLMGERPGSPEEKAELWRIRNEIGDRIYTEAIYVLAHKIIPDPRQAKDLYDGILQHRRNLVKLLRRDVGIQMTALDYLRNILKILDHPTIIEEEKVRDLAEKAVEDDKTEALTSDLLLSDLENEIERSKRYNSRVSVVFMDLDNMKKVNDRYGYWQGDRVLKFVSRTVRKAIRRLDTLYRWGGDEFVVLLPGVDASSATEVARRIREHLAREARTDTGMPLSVSAGVASYGAPGIADGPGLIKAADKALYAAKRRGRGRIGVYAAGRPRVV
jgi:diguanylate cyclase (GGDEF)-like protein